jgi:acyl-lipid omega-6 desaturase (Delta-12 desaturase)
VRATLAYAVEDRARSWRLLAVTLACLVGAQAGAVGLPGLGPKLLAAVGLALLNLRLFSFFHDYAHGAQFRGDRLGRAVLWLSGLYLLTPSSVWKQTHDYHHQNTAKLVGTWIGAFPLLSVELYGALSAKERLAYRWIRHPANLLLGYLTVFAFGMCLGPFWREPRRHWAGPLALGLHLGAVAGCAALLGAPAALVGVVLPRALVGALGAYFFFVQHNAEGICVRPRQQWEYGFAALRSSTYFEMGPLMRWLTGNGGYHHVHHLNHRIPFYRLPEAHQALPEAEATPKVRWRLTDAWRAIGLHLWSPAQGRLVGYREAARARGQGTRT